MIILTQPNISQIEPKPKRISSIVQYVGTEYCLAEVGNDFGLPEHTMKILGIDYWWKLCSGYIDPKEWDYELKFKGGLIEGVERQYDLTKESNIAMCISVIASNAAIDPFVLWENTILKQNL